MRVIELDGSMGWTAEKDAFVCAESTVDFDIAFQGWKAGRKSGEGFVLEKFTGVGTLVIAGAGNFIELNPAKYGGTIEVDTGCVVAFQDSISYEMRRVGGLNAQTLMGAMFAGQGLSVATLSGDGTVILQSMTYDGIANALFARVHQNDNTGHHRRVSSAPPRAETARPPARLLTRPVRPTANRHPPRNKGTTDHGLSR